MESDGSMIDIDRFSREIFDFSTDKWGLDRLDATKQALEKLSVLSKTIRQSARDGDAASRLHVERLCISMEKALYANTEDEEERYDKQLVENMSAEGSLKSLQDAPRYRERFDELKRRGFSGSVPYNEPYETFVHRQCRYLGAAKTGFADPIEKDFFAARQANLQAGLKHYKELQRAALFPDVVRIEEEVKALGLVDDPKIWAEPRTDGQDYKGEIVHVDEERGYLVQHNGKKSLFVHQLDRLSKTPEIGENVKVSYPKDQEQKATVETVERQRSRSARR